MQIYNIQVKVYHSLAPGRALTTVIYSQLLRMTVNGEMTARRRITTRSIEPNIAYAKRWLLRIQRYAACQDPTPPWFFTRAGGSLACYRVHSVSRRAVTFRVEGKQQMNIRSAATRSALARPRLGALDLQIISLESLI
jgi:hypothetical protein